MKTLESYLRTENESSGVIDFRIRILMPSKMGERLSFYIHPIDKDGNTGDFWIDGNKLTPVFPEPKPGGE